MIIHNGEKKIGKYLGMIFASLSGFDIRETKELWKRMKALKKGKEISEFMSTQTYFV